MKIFALKTLRGRMILLALIIVNIPILVAGYMMKQSAEYYLLEEKKSKLAAIAVLLDERLAPGGYAAILERHNALNTSKEDKIRIINAELAAATDEIAHAGPGLGVGFYSKELDAIVAYGPSQDFGHTIGLPIQESHPGRQVMEDDTFRVEFGTLVRGNIMNAMRPIDRNGQVIGYIWANELTDDVHAQLAAMDRSIFISIGLGMLLSMMLILAFTENVVGDVQTIIEGVRRIRFDLSERIFGPRGEMGEIAATINEFAEALGDARSLSENIMDSMADGIIAVDTHAIITSLNRSAETLTGFTAEEVVGRSYEEVFCSHTWFHSLLLDTLATGTPHIGGEIDYPVKYGVLWISISTSLLKNFHGESIGAVVVFKDLSEKKRLEAQVSRADRLATLGELMAGVAHEIRNPLTSIKGFLQYFQQAGTDEERAVYIPLMLRETERMNRIIESLLYFARPCELELAPTDLRRVMREAILLIRNRAEKQDIDFEVEMAENIPLTEVDEEQFKQVFLNLLINAVQALEQGGKIVVTARFLQEPDAVEIVIADNGPGIPKENREKVFDPFFTTKRAGTGLGMSVVQRIMLAQGGQISLGENPGGGLLVRLLIPRTRKEHMISHE